MFRLPVCWMMLLCCCGTLSAQITSPRILSASPGRFATLEEQLVNRLHATAEDQRNYLHFVVEQVRLGKLDGRIVVALERYALRRNRSLPFPFFERSLRYEASRRGVQLPPVRQFATARVPDGIRRY